MFVSVVYSNAESYKYRSLSKYVFNYSLNGSKPIEVEVEGLIYNENNEDYHEAIYNDAIRAAIDLMYQLKLNILKI
jgi:hypothetical protein